MEWEHVKEILYRSYAGKLLEVYVEQFDKQVEGKIDFTLMSKREEALEHIEEVFEQDLRLGEQNDVTAFCKDHALIVRNAILKLLSDKGSEIKNNLCIKGIMPQKTFWITST